MSSFQIKGLKDNILVLNMTLVSTIILEIKTNVLFRSIDR